MRLLHLGDTGKSANLAWFHRIAPGKAGAPVLVVNQHISGRGYPVGQVVIQAFVLVVTIAANTTLLPRLGPVGASIAAILTYGIWLGLDFAYLWLSKRRRER